VPTGKNGILANKSNVDKSGVLMHQSSVIVGGCVLIGRIFRMSLMEMLWLPWRVQCA
jgi:hypothetical protein